MVGTPSWAVAGRAMLTRDILFRMNVPTLVGLVLTGFGLTLHRSANAGLPLCFGVMGVGTVLVLVGLYVSGSPNCNSQVLVRSIRAGAIGQQSMTGDFRRPSSTVDFDRTERQYPSASNGGSACRRT